MTKERTPKLRRSVLSGENATIDSKDKVKNFSTVNELEALLKGARKTRLSIATLSILPKSSS